jgi:predicted RNase H-like HicB family nuclease
MILRRRVRGGIVKHAVAQEEVEINAHVRHEDGMYWAEVPSHPGLFASGATLDELTEALLEAWCLYTHDVVPQAIKRAGDARAPASRRPRRAPAARVDELKLAVPV